MSTEASLLVTIPATVAERVMVAVHEGRPVDPEDAATLAAWILDTRGVLSGVRRVETAVG